MLFTLGCTAFEDTQRPGSNKEVSSVAYQGGADEYAPVPMVAYSDGLPMSENTYDRSHNQANSVIEQKIIKTANIQVEVSNVTQSSDKIKKIVTTHEGIVQSVSITTGHKNNYTGIIIVRIPSLNFDHVLDDFNSLGKILSSSVKSDDVTEEYVDLNAQKNSLINQLAQYNRLLTKTENVSEILEVQKEIDRVQMQLDRITGKMRYMDNQISLSTITVSLTEPEQVETPGGMSIPQVMNEGIEGFFNTIIWLFILIFTILPLVLVGGVVYLIYKKWKKSQLP